MTHALPDSAIVVRGGRLDPDRLLARAVRDRRDDDVSVLSVWCGVKADDETVDDVLRRLVEEAPIPHGQLNVTTAGALREAGFELRAAPPPDCHYDLELGTVLDSNSIDTFVGTFDIVRSNVWRRNA
jgi:hypothetical protein